MGKDKQVSERIHTKFQVVLSAMRNKGWCAGKKGNFREIDREALTDEMIFVPRPEWQGVNHVRVWRQSVLGRGRESIKAPGQVQT